MQNPAGRRANLNAVVYAITGDPNNLTVRARKPGDRFRPLGMIAEKSVKNFFIDAKVPQPWRPLVPIIVNPGQVIWVAGYRIDDRVKVTSSSRRVLHLEFIRLGST